MAIMAFRTAWVDAVKPIKTNIRNLFRDEVAAYLTVSELQGKDTGGTRFVLVSGAPFIYDPADTTSADNGVNIIVSNDGGCYKLASFAREKLTANRTYYVRKDGSDSNSGLANTAGGAYVTIQKALNAAAALDPSIYSVTISVDGTGASYAENLTIPVMLGGKLLTLTTSTGANIAPASGSPITANIPGVNVQVTGFTLTAASATHIGASNGARVAYSGITFTASALFHISSQSNALVINTGAYTIAGGAYAHHYANGGRIALAGITVTLTGTPAFAYAFAAAQVGASIEYASTVFSGSGTGARYNVTAGSVIMTFGAASTYLPGNSAGTANTAAGGFYV